MANTSISDICSKIAQNQRAENSKTEGIASEDVAPGEYVVFTSGTWTLADSDTAAHKLLRGAVVSYRRRKNDADSNPSIDDDYDIDAEPNLASVPLIRSGIVACKITDQTGTVYPGAQMIVSSTAGALTVLALEATGATSGTAIRSVIVGTLARKIVTADTVAFVDLNAEGRIY